MNALSAPEPLTPAHAIHEFTSGVDQLDDWFRRRALGNEAEGGSRTFVIAAGGKVAGFYSLATGSIMRAAATSQVRRNMPDPVPVILIGRLAVDQAWQGQGVGAYLLRDAAMRCQAIGAQVGVNAILVHAISDAAKLFYERHGFESSPVEPRTLMLTLAHVSRSLIKDRGKVP